MDRPHPPEALFNNEFERFRVADEVLAWTRATFMDRDSPLYNAEHDHLRDAKIGMLWTTIENVRQMRRVAAQAEMTAAQGSKWTKARSEQQLGAWFGELPDFIITIDAVFAATISDLDWCALVEHELLHCAQSKDKYGTPKFDRYGSPVYAIRGHDVEEFTSIVARYGVGGDQNLQKFIEAATMQPSIGAMDIGKCCGNCL